MESKPISLNLESKAKKSASSKKKGDLNEAEQKRIQQKIQTLTNQLIDTKKELEKVEKNAQDWKTIAEKNEKSLNILSDKLLEPSDKLKKVGELNAPANATKLLKNQLRQQEKILELEDKIQDLSMKNEDLEKAVLLEAKAKNSKLENEIKDMLKRLSSLKSENLSLQNQIDKLASSLTQSDINKEAEHAKQMNIRGYEARIQDLEQCERDLREELLKAEHQNLEMKFDNNNSNSKVSKLKDKIYELENYIHIYTQLPPSMISKANANKDLDIEKELMQKPGASKRPAAELERVIEGLKRVINTQKSELENLKKKESRYKAAQEKVSTNKLLKDEISNLESEIKAFEVKDKKVEELEIKSQKLSEANKHLVNDIRNEQKRYEFLESKYKELLIKYNITSKDLEKKQDSLFTMSTGANKGTYEDYLLHGDQV